MLFPLWTIGAGLLYGYWVIRLNSPKGYRFRIWDVGATVLGAVVIGGLLF